MEMGTLANFSELPIPHPSSLPSVEDIRLSRSTIKQLDQEIQVVQERMKALRMQLQNLQQKRANHASYIAPLRRVPMEILREIVKLCWEDGMDMRVLLNACSRIRQAVMGLSAVWTKICLPSIPYWELWPKGHRIQEGIRCFSIEQLDWTLTRAGKLPLDLSVDWPMRKGLLELISSRKIPIETLSIRDPRHHGRLDDPCTSFLFEGLNFTLLRNLSLDIEAEQVPSFMDLALQSTQNQFQLEVEHQIPDINVLSHRLMERVVTMRVLFKLPYEDARLDVDFPPRVPLPSVTKWILHGDLCLLEAFDFGGAQSLELTFDSFGYQVLTSPIPSHLKELYIAGIELNPETTSVDQRFCLPNLTTLPMDDIAIWYSLRDYLEMPKLKLLHLSRIYLRASDLDDDEEEEFKGPVASSFKGLFGELPELEYLVLCKVKLNGILAKDLGKCVLLKTLDLTCCKIKGFIRTFFEEITDKEYLPCLRILNISDSWTSQSDISHASFMQHCRVQRPGIHAYGDADSYDGYGEDSMTETDFDSGSDEDSDSSPDSTSASDTELNDGTD